MPPNTTIPITLTLPHLWFSPKSSYRGWHEVAEGHLGSLGVRGTLKFLALKLTGWVLVDYSPDGVIFARS